MIVAWNQNESTRRVLELGLIWYKRFNSKVNETKIKLLYTDWFLYSKSLSVPPKIENYAEAVMLCNANAALEFVITGTPTPKVYVCRDDQPLSQNDHIHFLFEKGKFSLVINSVVHEDAGTYKITAENKAGHANSTAYIHTQGISCQNILGMILPKDNKK